MKPRSDPPTTAPEGAPLTAGRPSGRRWRRVLRRIAIALAIVLVLLLGAFALLLTNLDSAFVKGLVTDHLRESYALDLDYRVLEVTLGGDIHMEGLRIGTPAEFSEHAPDLLRVERFEASVELSSLFGDELVVPRVEVRGVEARVVRDAGGRTSLDALAEGFGPPAEEAPVPPTQALALPNLGQGLRIAAFDATTDVIELIDLSSRHGPTRATFRGIHLSGYAHARRGGLAAELRVASGGGGARVTLPTGEALATVDVQVHVAGPHAAEVRAKVLLERQTLVEGLASGPLVDTAASLRFLPEERRIRADLMRFDLLGDGGKATLTVDLLEDEALALHPVIRGGSLHLALDDADMEALRALSADVPDVHGASLDVVVSDMHLDPTEGAAPMARGRAVAEGHVERLQIERDGKTTELRDVTLAAEARATGPFTFDVHGTVKAARVATTGVDEQATTTGLVAEVDLRRLQLDPSGVYEPRGIATAVASIDEIELARPGSTARITGLSIDAATALTGSAPYGGLARLPFEAMELRDTAAQRTITVRDADLTVLGWGLPPGLLTGPAGARAEGRLGTVTVEEPGRTSTWIGARLDAAAGLDGGGLDVEIRMPARALSLDWPAQQLALTVANPRAELLALDLRIPKAGVAQAKGRVRARLGAGGLSLESGAASARGAGLDGEITATLTGGPPYAFTADTSAAELEVRPASGPAPPAIRGGRVSIDVTELVPDAAAPLGARGAAAATFDLGAVRGSCAGRIDVGEASGQARLEASSLGPLAGLLPASVRRAVTVPWERVGVSLHAKGTVRGLTEGQQTTFDGVVDASLDRVAVSRRGFSLRAPRIGITGAVEGSARAFEAELDLHLASPRINRFVGHGALDVTARTRWDSRSPKLDLAVSTGGAGAPEVEGKLSLELDRATKRLRYEAEATLANLEAAALLLPEAPKGGRPPVVVTGGRLTASGDLRGLVRRFNGPLPVFAEPLFEGVDGTHQLALHARGVEVRSADGLTEIPDLTLSMHATADDGEVHGTLDLAADRVDVRAGAIEVGARGAAATIEVRSTGEVRSGVLTATIEGSVASVEQTAIAGLGISGLTLAGKARLERLEGLRVDRFVFENPAGGTRLELTAAMDGLRLGTSIPEELGGTEGAVRPVPGRQSLTIEGTLTQRLEPLSRISDAIRGRGTLVVPFLVESGDRSLYRVASAVEAQAVDLELPGLDLSLTGWNGRVAIEEEVDLGGATPTLIPGPGRNAYTQARFQDIHPFLLGGSFLTLDRLTWRGHSMGPIAGNLRVDRNVISLDQLQLEHAGGSVTGQLSLEYEKGASSVLFRGNVTGLRPTRSEEVLDANAALVLSPEKLEVEGRVQIVRMGRDHLLDALDLLDPYNEDPSINTIRKALALGYPKFVRLRLSHGFMSAKIELGGLAGVVSLGEIRGIPTGPLLSRFVSPLFQRGGPP